MSFHNVVGTGRYTTSTTNMYHKDFTYRGSAPQNPWWTLPNNVYNRVSSRRDVWRNMPYVKSVFIIHVGGTRYVTSSTDNIMKIHFRITLNVEFIRGYIFIFLFYV